MQNWAHSLVSLLLMAAPAAATPPQIVSVEDTLFARNADTLFILRKVTDNHGLHTVLQTDTLVAFRALDGGDDRGFRMVARVIEYGPDGQPRVQSLPLSATFNPYDLFVDFDAWPIETYDRPLPASLVLNDQGLQFEGYGYEGETAFGLTVEDISLRIEDTLLTTRTIAPLNRVGGGTTGPDPFGPALFDVTADCRVTAVHTFYDFADDPALARLTCNDTEELQNATLWLVVPQIQQ